MIGKLAEQQILVPVARYRLHFRGREPLRFTDFPGSAWRGALGHALKRLSCTTQLPRCEQCPEYRKCAYAEIFETPPPVDTERMRLYKQAPHPYVLSHRYLRPDAEEANKRCELIVTMIGRGDRYIELMVKALEEAATGPRGISGNRMRLEQVEREIGIGTNVWELWNGKSWNSRFPEGIVMPSAPNAAILQVITPLRVKRNGQRVGPREFQFSDLFINLMRRISQLSYFHTDHAVDTNWKQLSEAAKAVNAQTQLEWKDLTRYSNRQQTEMTLGGVTGKIQIEDDQLRDFWPFLWTGQWTHTGTGATMGLGRYVVHASLQTATNGSIKIG